MANETSVIAANPAPAAADTTEFEQTEFDATIRGRPVTFISIPHKEVKRDGNTKTERTVEFFIPKCETLHDKAEHVEWLLGLHDETEKDSGMKVIDRLLFRLYEAANENLVNEAGEDTPDKFIETLLRPQGKSGTGIAAIQKKLAEESLKITELYLIIREKNNPEQQQKMIAASGHTSIAQVLSKLDSLSQRTIELTRQLAQRRAEQAKREAMKLKKAQEMLATANAAAQEATPA